MVSVCMQGRVASSSPLEPAVGNSLWDQGSSRVIKGHQESSRAIKSHQGSSRVIKSHQGSSRAIKSHQEPSRAIKSDRHLHIRMARREAASARRRLLPLAVQPHERAGRRAERRRASRYQLCADGTVRVWLEEGGYEFRELAVLEHLMREAISRSSNAIKRQSEFISGS